MISTKEAFIDAKEVSQVLGVGMTKAYEVVKKYNAELDAMGYYTMRGKCPRKYFEQKIYGYADCYNPESCRTIISRTGLIYRSQVEITLKP